MIIKLHIQVANKQLNVYYNTIIILLLKAIYKKQKTDSLSLLQLHITKSSDNHFFRLFLTFSDFLPIKNDFRYSSCILYKVFEWVFDISNQEINPR